MSFENGEYLAAQAIEAGDYEQAVRLLRPLAERNSGYALLTLGWIYETGANGSPDKDAALTFYEDAASQGSATAHRYLGRVLLNDGRDMEARAVFERGARLGDDECKSELARLALYADEKLAGEALEDEAYEQAIGLLMPLAEHNSGYALLCLGYIYEKGLTVAPDGDAARSYYERAIAQGSADAHCHLGYLLLEQGEEARARAAFEAGAELGDLSSMSHLGRMIVDGRGGPTNLDAGTAWLEKAAAGGHIFAQMHLLVMKERKAKSIFEKLSLRMKRLPLAMKWTREMSKDAPLGRQR